MSNLKKILTIVIISVLITTMLSVVKATDNDDYTDIVDEGNTTTNNNTINNTLNTNLNNTNTNNMVNKTNNTIDTTNTLPKAGITENISVIIIAVIFGISAVYAYKKIKDYNIK